MIKIEDVHFSYPNGNEVLKGIDLEIGDGEFVAIMGENGAGKTTLVKMFNGLLKPSKGKIIVNGINTTHTSVARLAKLVGLVFQNPDHQLFCETVRDEVRALEESLRRNGVKWEKAMLTVDTLGTPAIPHLRITHQGYVRLKDQKILPLKIP